jgi:hypothetical protein
MFWLWVGIISLATCAAGVGVVYVTFIVAMDPPIVPPIPFRVVMGVGLPILGFWLGLVAGFFGLMAFVVRH